MTEASRITNAELNFVLNTEVDTLPIPTIEWQDTLIARLQGVSGTIRPPTSKLGLDAPVSGFAPFLDVSLDSPSSARWRKLDIGEEPGYLYTLDTPCNAWPTGEYLLKQLATT